MSLAEQPVRLETPDSVLTQHVAHASPQLLNGADGARPTCGGGGAVLDAHD